MPAEAEGVADSSVYRSVLGRMEGQVQPRVKGRIIRKMINGGRNDVVGY